MPFTAKNSSAKPSHHGVAGDPGIAHARIDFESDQAMVASLGPADTLLRIVSGVWPEVTLAPRGDSLELSGPLAGVKAVRRVVEQARAAAAGGNAVTATLVERWIMAERQLAAANPDPAVTGEILRHRGKSIRPKTNNQAAYVEAMDAHTITFGVGPAGTGKTYLAMARAVAALQSGEVDRIILTRPAVEAGENLGFLPGTLSDKIDPYLRPLYDALHDMVEHESIPRLIAAGTIEVAPLAYMRGRTLNNAFVILDEAQNTTAEQMKMFLTRLGFRSHIVVTGDITQIDLPGGKTSGLGIVLDILDGIDDIAICELSAEDVVRHRLVGKIVDAYQRWDEDHQRISTGKLKRAREPRSSGAERRKAPAAQSASASASAGDSESA